MTNRGQTEPKPNANASLPQGFGRRAADRIPAAALLEKAAELIGQQAKTKGDSMPKALADQKAADRKAFMAKGHTPPPKHVPQPKVDPTDPFGLAAKAAGKTVDTSAESVVESGHSNPNQPKDSTMTEDVKTPTKQEQAEAAAKAKMAAKAEKLAAADKAKAEKETKAKALAEEKAKAKAAKDAERQKKAEEKQAEAASKLAGDGRKYTGTMLALAEKVKAGVYVKGAHGQLRSTDDLAVALDCVPPANVVKLAMLVLGEETNKYAALNIGQQSMNYRNRLRGALKAKDTKITIDTIKQVRDDNGFVVEPTPKAVKPAKTAAPAADKTPAPTISAEAAATGIPA